MSSIDVIYAANLKSGDLYAGKINPDAPTTPVQPFAAALRLSHVTAYTADDGTKMLSLETAAGFTLFPVAAYSQVLVIRESKPT